MTLFELLLCVGLIALISTLAMPFFSTTEGAMEARDRRNAQTLCSMCNVVQAAGIPLIQEGQAKLQIIEELRNGITIEEGPLRGKTFRVPNLADEEMTAASRYLIIHEGELVYTAVAVDG